MAKTSTTPTWLGCAWLALAASCAPDRNVGVLVEECREAMEPKIYDHACQHGRLGPFEAASAVPATSVPVGLVSARQRTIEIELPPHALDEDGISYLQYQPSRDGQHAVFSGADRAGIAVTMWQGDREIPRTPIVAVRDPDRCGGMSEVTGFELTAGQLYTIELGPTAATRMRLFVEHVGSFGTQWSSLCAP